MAAGIGRDIISSQQDQAHVMMMRACRRELVTPSSEVRDRLRRLPGSSWMLLCSSTLLVRERPSVKLCWPALCSQLFQGFAAARGQTSGLSFPAEQTGGGA